ncbi:hypothetical protein [Salinispora cortesiana]|uniref:hypothetical protein n=1 Tax=Salinispora cortesiana TaxID=1305843 RepID=UPI000418AC82|nr:hypothetical protein [Salinispora cortesiana]
MTALGTAAGAGAAALGFGYGLGIINWAPPPDETVAITAWTASLIWATWIAATSTVAGAICAQRLRHRGPVAHPPTGSHGELSSADSTADNPSGPDADAATPREWRSQAEPGASDSVLGKLALAGAAGFGALITVLLTAVPARVAAVPGVAAPREVAAGYAALGVLVGVAIAAWALHSRAAATNVISTVGWLWLLAVVAVVDGVIVGRGLNTAQLGIWQLSVGGTELWLRDWFYWPGALLSLGSALLIGVLVARGTAQRPDQQVGATASGAAGPLLVAVAYLLAVPDLADLAPGQASAHLIAPYAVIIGFGGSALVTAVGQRANRRKRADSPRLAQPPTDSPRPTKSPTNPEPDGSTVATPTTRGRTRGSGSRRPRTVKADATSEVPAQRAADDAPAADAAPAPQEPKETASRRPRSTRRTS